MAIDFFVVPVTLASRISPGRGSASGLFGVSAAFTLLRDSDGGLRLLTSSNYTGVPLSFTARRNISDSPIISKSSSNANQMAGGKQFIYVHFVAADTANLLNGETLIAHIVAAGVVVYEFKLMIYV